MSKWDEVISDMVDKRLPNMTTDKDLKPTFPENPKIGEKHYHEGTVREYQYSGEWTVFPPTDGLRGGDEWQDEWINSRGYEQIALIERIQQNAIASQAAKLRVMREALTTIAKQKYVGEQDKDEDGEIMGCLETGYDDIIEIARRALALADKE